MISPVLWARKAEGGFQAEQQEMDGVSQRVSGFTF